jgi:hypothetical protein
MDRGALSVFVSNADGDVQDALPDVLAGRLGLNAVLAFCQHFRIKGLATLRLGGSSDALFAELDKSGHAFLHFLGTAGEDQQATSRHLPFFDALAAADLPCARGIALHSRRTFNPDREYEDDFLFMRLLMQLVLAPDRPDAGRRLLDRHRQVTDRDDSAEHALAAALLDRDAASFRRALGQHLEAERAHLRQLVAREKLEEEVAATAPYLSVPGLALVRLAELRGLRVPRRQKGLSSLAQAVRTATPGAFPPEAWRRPVGQLLAPN